MSNLEGTFIEYLPTESDHERNIREHWIHRANAVGCHTKTSTIKDVEAMEKTHPHLKSNHKLAS